MEKNEQLAQLRSELMETRKASLYAVKMGKFMQVARLTTKAAQINKAIFDLETQLMAHGISDY